MRMTLLLNVELNQFVIKFTLFIDGLEELSWFWLLLILC